MEKKEREGRGHVLVLTYPSQGHINPLLQFAKRLASKGLKATFATTHYTVKSICALGVQVEPISDGFDNGGFAQAPNVNAYVESFKKIGSKTLSQLISKLDDLGYRVNCLVYDAFLPWALDVAKQHGIYGAAFLTNSATVCSLYWRASLEPLAIPENVPVSLPGLPPLGFNDLPSFLVSPASYPAYLAMIMDKFTNLEAADWVLLNSFEELEDQVTKVMSKLWPVIMVGPMIPSAFLDTRISDDTHYGANLWNPTTNHDCLTWLEGKPPMSVVYVSFGSMAEVGRNQIEEIAWGLKGTNLHFIWVLRESEQIKLPKDFIDSTKEEKGLVVTWCNQLEMLDNKAMGCFVTHCGWNSTLEGLSLGVPMVGVPQWTDQPTNAKFVEEVWGVGMRAKVDDKGIVRRDELEKCIGEVMEGERRQLIKINAKKWKELAKEAVSEGGSSDKNIDKFVSEIKD